MTGLRYPARMRSPISPARRRPLWGRAPFALLLSGSLLAGCRSGGVSGGKADPTLVYKDGDGDGWGDEATQEEAKTPPPGWVTQAGDCDDTDADVHPAAEELCNGHDDNCDRVVDDGFDLDGDGHEATACPDGDDCDDGDAAVYPGATDACGDGLDADCGGDDDTCLPEGGLADADAKRWGTDPAGDAGAHMDVGDLDGDGDDDIVIGAMWAHSYQGSAWVIPGPVTGWEALGDSSIEIKGGSGSYEGGRTVAVGDVNADGFDDVLLGSPDASAYDAVIVFGPVTEDMNFSEADFRGQCAAPVECGHGGDLADLNGDGVLDALIAAGEATTGGPMSGSVYLFYGPLDTMDVELQTDFDAELVGASTNSETGRVDKAGGDLNGDGVGDLLITASYDSEGGPYAGAVHVVYGPVSGTYELSGSDGKLVGASAYDYAGEALTMGDLDGDGLSDAIIGGLSAASGAGRVWVVPGPAAGTTRLSEAAAILSGDSGSAFGSSIDTADLDLDGRDALLVGAGEASVTGPGGGAAYLYAGAISGGLGTEDATLSLASEQKRDGAGRGVGFGDADNDGIPDLLIGATRESTGARQGGALYVLLSSP